MVSSSLSAGVMFLLCKELLKNIFSDDETKKLSLISGLVVCFAGAAVKSGIVIMSDALGLLLLMCGILLLARYYNYSERTNLIVSFAFFSLGAMTRYADALIALPVLIILANLYINSPGKTKLLKDLLISACAAIIIFIPELYYISKYGIAYFRYEGTAATWAAGWNPLNYFRKDFTTFDGTQHYKLWNILFVLGPSFHPGFLSLFGISLIWGLVTALRKKYTAIILFCFLWITVYCLYLAGNPFQSIRYTLSFFPALVCLSALGLGSVKINDKIKNIYVIIGFVLLFSYFSYDISKLADQKAKEFEVTSFVNREIPENAVLFTFEITGAVNHYTTRNALEFFNNDPEGIKQKINSETEDIYFILPVENFTKQWKDRPIEKTFNYLTANYTLDPVKVIDKYLVLKLRK